MIKETVNQSLVPAVEAILIAAEETVTVTQLAQVLAVDEQEVDAVIAQLQQDYADRGFVLRQVAQGYRLYSSPEYDEIVTRFLQGQRESTLSQAALETLAVIAYRQPVTRAAVAAVRGVNVDGVCRTLEAHGLIERCGQSDSGATLWGTTSEFMEIFGLSDLNDLPPLAPYLPDMTELDDVIERLEANGDRSA